MRRAIVTVIACLLAGSPTLAQTETPTSTATHTPTATPTHTFTATPTPTATPTGATEVCNYRWGGHAPVRARTRLFTMGIGDTTPAPVIYPTPGTGSVLITGLMVSADAATTVSISSNGRAIVPPIAFGAAGMVTVPIDPNNPICGATGHPIKASRSGSANVTITAIGMLVP